MKKKTMFQTKRILSALLSVVLAGGILGTNPVSVTAEPQATAETTEVSENSTDSTQDGTQYITQDYTQELVESLGMELGDDDTLSVDVYDMDEEEKDNIMLYQGISLEEAAALRQRHLEKNADAEFETSLIPEEISYLKESAWDSVPMEKGTQASGQVFFNLILNDVLSSSYGVEYVYEGEVYYFNRLSHYVNAIKAANAAGLPVHVELLMRIDADLNMFKLYDPNALANVGNRPKTTRYIAPNVTGADSKYCRAMYAYLAQLFSQENCHIDNWIVGNEVNMPNAWYFTGNADPEYNADLYSHEYLAVYNAVRKYTSKSRVSFCFDHSWQHNDEGRGIAVKDYLPRLVDRINQKQANVDWTISYHLYPAYLPEPAIWTSTPFEGIYGSDLNPRDESAKFVDGNNLFILTDYVKNNYGTSHKIMCTEQGFTKAMGDDVQAAGLALSYYAAKYDPMVDAFIINVNDESDLLCFALSPKAQSVWDNIDNNAFVESQVLPTIGISSFAELVPNYGKEVLKPDRTKIKAFVRRIYQLGLEREPEEEGLLYWTDVLAERKMSGAQVAGYFFFSKEMTDKNLSNEEFLERLYQVMMDRSSDAEGAAYWCDALDNGYGRKGVFNGFCNSKEFKGICSTYGIECGTYPVTGSSRSRGLSAFVCRLYTKALGRPYDKEGIDYWCEVIYSKKCTIDEVASTQFFHSKEFLSKNLNDREYLEVVYRTFMGREYDEEGMEYWLKKLSSKSVNRDDVLYYFVNSKEFKGIKSGFGL